MLTPKEVAALTGLSYRSVLRAIEDGELRAFRLRGRLRVDREDYMTWLQANVIEIHETKPATIRPLRAQRPRASLRALHESTLTE